MGPKMKERHAEKGFAVLRKGIVKTTNGLVWHRIVSKAMESVMPSKSQSFWIRCILDET